MKNKKPEILAEDKEGNFILGGNNPDFVNVNGEKICVETANRYHHQGDYEQKRIEHFAKYGWRCVVLFADFKSNKWIFDKSDEEILKELKGDIN